MKIDRPKFQSVPLADGLKWTGGSGFIYEEKLDGVWHVLTLGLGAIVPLPNEWGPIPHRAPRALWPSCPCVLVGELMPDQNFYVFDIVSQHGYSIQHLPLRDRLEALDMIVPRAEPQSCPSHRLNLRRPQIGSGGEFLEAVLARGGEGIVAKHLDEPFGATWYKCKRVETFDLIVAEKNADGKSSIRLAWSDGTDAGWCPCRGGFDAIVPGMIVEIAAYGRTVAGKLREPRFIRIRPDKANPQSCP